MLNCRINLLDLVLFVRWRSKLYFFFFFFFLIFLFCFRERESMSRGEGPLEGGRARERERERKNLKQAPCSVWSLMQGSVSQPWDHNLSWSQDSGAQTTELPGWLWEFLHSWYVWERKITKMYLESNLNRGLLVSIWKFSEEQLFRPLRKS